MLGTVFFSLNTALQNLRWTFSKGNFPANAWVSQKVLFTAALLDDLKGDWKLSINQISELYVKRVSNKFIWQIVHLPIPIFDPVFRDPFFSCLP